MVEWRRINEAPAYEVSNEGVVRRATPSRTAPAGYIMKQKLSRFGYCVIHISVDGVYLYRFVHRLVAVAFLGDQPSKQHEVAHNNGVRTDNRSINLRWATKVENMADRSAHGLWVPEHGEGHHAAILNDSLVLQMRMARHDGHRITDIARKFGVKKLTAYDAITGKTWRHLNDLSQH